MKFAPHSELAGSHAFLSASSYHWLRYSDEKLVLRYDTAMAAARGTRLHDLAKKCIDERVKLAGNGTTLSRYVNDAIGFGMETEVILFYSFNCYGTVDAISFNPRTKTLRIHDLKTGVSPTKMDQLLIYTAIFFLEYAEYKPLECKVILRIYQNDAFVEYIPELDEIVAVMDKIITSDRILNERRMEAYS